MREITVGLDMEYVMQDSVLMVGHVVSLYAASVLLDITVFICIYSN